MHPSPAFQWSDREAMLAFLANAGFGTFVVLAPGGAAIVHAPLLVQSDDRVRLHLSRRNAAAVSAPTPALLSVLGPHAYISPDWYGTKDQVPTWNYVTVECEGVLAPLPQNELAPLLDALSAANEERLPGKRAWTRDKMSSERFEALCRAIVPYELTISIVRGTRKLGQNKQEEEVQGACAALRSLGQGELADLMAGAEA